ncbi:MAG: flagellar biosynthesis anti-sigma factor FlgM [Phycisphaerales bacterium]|jgi:anti-sigma28 factor (negative regulator of flagellin synthesis)
MSDVTRLDSLNLRQTFAPANRPVGVSRPEEGAGSTSSTITRGEDRLEVSAMASYLSKLNALPAVRHELVNSVRARIEAGTYETQDKLDIAFDELIREVRG